VGTIKAVNPTDKWRLFGLHIAALFLEGDYEARKITTIYNGYAKKSGM